MAMRKYILLLASFFVMALPFYASPVRAQTVAWVSANGSGTTCTQTAPCATFQAAINTGAPEIGCLTSGNYGAVTITASITIDCGSGNVGNIVVSGVGGQAVGITASAAATIVLRHLGLDGLGTASFGIAVSALPSGSLIVEDCVIEGFAQGEGIFFTTSSGRGLLQVSNSRLVNNAFGIEAFPTNSQIETVMLDRVELVGNSNIALDIGGGASGVMVGTMRDSVVGANFIGVRAQATQVFFTIEGSSIVANPRNGILTGSAGSNVNVTATTISGNGTGVSAPSGSIISFGNNTLNGNGSDGSFTSTTALH
jgi:hypothetical protein